MWFFHQVDRLRVMWYESRINIKNENHGEIKKSFDELVVLEKIVPFAVSIEGQQVLRLGDLHVQDYIEAIANGQTNLNVSSRPY